jgi:hypothetical protein
MEHVDGRLIFSATDLINHLECPHLTRLNIQVALGREDPEPSRSDTTNLVARKGDEHERAHLDRLAEEGWEIVRVESEPGLEGTRRGARETVEAMRAGAEVIYQGGCSTALGPPLTGPPVDLLPPSIALATFLLHGASYGVFAVVRSIAR